MRAPPSLPTAPIGWPRASHPLRVLLLGWARLSFQGNQGSGYNLSASELAAGLALMGHHVHYLASGRKYDLWPGMHVSFTEQWRGVACYDLVNSPNVSPASYNFENVRAEADHPAQVRVVKRFVDDHAIDVVHAHSLEGFPLSLIAALREAGVPVVVTPHNYWYICSQVDLMRGETHLCLDYEGGTRCVGCIRRKSAPRTRLKRRLGQSVESLLGMSVTGSIRQMLKDAKDRIAELRGTLPTEIPNDRDPDPEAALGLEIAGPGAMDDGLVRHNIKELRPPMRRRAVGETPPDANERFLAGDRHLIVLNEYGRRRSAGVEALNHASAVIPPSDFMRQVYVKMGVREERTRTVRLGQPHFDQIHRRIRRSPFYDAVPWTPQSSRPLRLGFFGAMRSSKGIDVLAAAIQALPRDVRQRCQFFIRAWGLDWPLRKPLSAYPEVSWLGGYDILQLVGSSGDYDVGLLPHVWLENSPLVLLEHLHAGKFVVCSRLGGPVEWVREGENGLLVTGGKVDELIGAITRLVAGEVAIPTPRQIHDRTPLLRGWPDHVREVESIYHESLRR